MKSFLKTGCVVCTLFLIASLFYEWIRPDISITASSSDKELPIYCVKTDRTQVALTFDAAWGNEYTGQILEILEKHQVHATFFMTGNWVDSFPEDVKKIAEAGHDLGNHSESHKNMSTLSDEKCKEELLSVHNKVKSLTGIDMELFRPPYGDYNNHVIANARSCGYYTIQWDCDSLDWKDYGAASIIDTVCNHPHLGNGSIILMHNGAKYTTKALDTIISTLEEKGYEIVPLSQLIIKENYHIDQDGRQIPDN